MNKKQLFKNKNFLKLWTAHFLSQISSYTLLFLAINKIFQTSNSNIATGIVWISFTLPNLFISPFIGPLIDFWNKKKILIQTNFLHSLIIGCGALAIYKQKIFVIFPILFIHAIISTINNPAEVAKTPDVIQNKKHLPIANNILFFSDQGSLILGSTLVGILLNFTNAVNTLIFSSGIALLASFVATLLPTEKEQTGKQKLKFNLKNLLKKIQEGYDFFTQNHLILYSFGLIVLFRVLISTSILLLPSIAKYIFKISIYNSYLIIIPLTLGLTIGTIILGKKQNGTRKKSWIGKGFTFASLTLLTAALVQLKPHPLQLLLHLILLFFFGISAAVIYAPIQTFIQEFTPGKMYGHTFSSLTFFSTLFSIPSSLITTTLAEIFGIRLFLIIVSCILLTLGYFINKKGNDIIKMAANNRS